MFIGYYTIYGPTGYVQAATCEEVESELVTLLDKYPNALSGRPRKNWWYEQVTWWRATVWSRIELVGN